MDLDKELEAVMEAESNWKGSPEKMWQRVEGDIRRRESRKRWTGRLLPAAAAAAVLVFTWAVKPGSVPQPTTPPDQVGVETPPPDPITKLPTREPQGGLWLDMTLERWVRMHDTIVLGRVEQVQDTAKPCIDDHHDDSPPPPDHPKAKGWTPPGPCEPFPAKLVTVRVIERFKGSAAPTLQIQQLVPSERIVRAGGQQDTLMKVGSTYLFFLSPPTDGPFEEWGARMEVGVDNHLRAAMESNNRLTAVKDLTDLTPEQAAEKIRSVIP